MVQPTTKASRVRSLVRLGFFLCVAGGSVAVAGSGARADESRELAPALFVPMIVKVVDYDRHFAERANGKVRALVVYRDGDTASVTTSHEIVRLLGKTEKIRGLSHTERAVPYVAANALASQIRDGQFSLVIISTGLGSEAAAIAHELDGIDTLSVAVDPDDVSNGIVLGIDARAGKSTLVVRLAQARRQNVAFEAALLKLARIE
jgi:hypothetical protein